MKLLMQAKCYTDMCLHGKWFHHDHGETSAYTHVTSRCFVRQKLAYQSKT